MLVRQINTFISPKGEKVEELKLIDAKTGLSPSQEEIAKLNEPEKAYVGTAMIGISMQDPSGGPPQVGYEPIQFPIDANSIEEAFFKFKESLEAYVNKIKEQQQKMMSNPGLIVPSAGDVAALTDKNSGIRLH